MTDLGGFPSTSGCWRSKGSSSSPYWIHASVPAKMRIRTGPYSWGTRWTCGWETRAGNMFWERFGRQTRSTSRTTRNRRARWIKAIMVPQVSAESLAPNLEMFVYIYVGLVADSHRWVPRPHRVRRSLDWHERTRVDSLVIFAYLSKSFRNKNVRKMKHPSFLYRKPIFL